MSTKSEKSYVVAVSLSGFFGFLGVQHFYLGRYLEGLIDVLLTIAWLYYFIVERPLIGLTYLGIDFLHAFITTILLLTGSMKDGKGHVVCYPGQTLK